MVPEWGVSNLYIYHSYISEHMWLKKLISTCEIALGWMPLNTFDDESTLAQVMAWCCKQQAITWGIVDPDLCHHLVSLGHNELTVNNLVNMPPDHLTSDLLCHHKALDIEESTLGYWCSGDNGLILDWKLWFAFCFVKFSFEKLAGN